MGMATKEQERNALKKIREIVADLGQDSYLRFAFEGCFEDAELNIENDFACSMMQRWEESEKKAAELEAALRKSESENEEYRKRIKELYDVFDSCQNDMANEKKTRLDEDTYKRLWLLAADQLDATAENIMTAAATIAEGDVESINYTKAIDGMAGLFRRKKDLESLVEQLEKIGDMLGY